jgi:hypothetical protein
MSRRGSAAASTAVLGSVVIGALLLGAASDTAQEGPAPVARVGATVVDPAGAGAAPLRNAALVVRGGRIECVGARAACPVPSGVETRDVEFSAR